MRVRIGDLDVAYARAGHGPPLVLLHGALCDRRLWRRQPGAGRSSDPPEEFVGADPGPRPWTPAYLPGLMAAVRDFCRSATGRLPRQPG